MLCVLCLIVLWGFSLVTSYSGVIDFEEAVKTCQEALRGICGRQVLVGTLAETDSQSEHGML